MAKLYFLLICIVLILCQLGCAMRVSFNVELNNENNNLLGTVNELEQEESVGKNFIYRVGARIIGDALVARGSDTYTYASPRNITVTLHYPQSGIGKAVSYVEIHVAQSSPYGSAHIVSGGIHQRQITIIVQANVSTYLTWTAFIYGY